MADIMSLDTSASKDQPEPRKRPRPWYAGKDQEEQPSKVARPDLLNLAEYQTEDNQATSAPKLPSPPRKDLNIAEQQRIPPRAHHTRTVLVKVGQDTVLANILNNKRTSRPLGRGQGQSLTPVPPKLCDDVFSSIQFSTHLLIDRVRSKLNFLSERQRMASCEPLFRQKWDGDAVAVSSIPPVPTKVLKQRLHKHSASRRGTSSTHDGIRTPSIYDILRGWKRIYRDRVYGPILNWNRQYHD